MKVIRAGLLVVFFVAVVSLAGLRARSARNNAETQLTFAQLADAHLFDEASKQPLAAADGWNALHWSIDRINALAQSGKGIDFVVYTGHLGLQNVDFRNARGCSVNSSMVDEDSRLTPEETALKKLMTELDRLTVRTLFFVSGTGDPSDKETTDGRFDCFLLGLQERAQALDRPLPIQKLGADHCFALKGFHLLGLSRESLVQSARDGTACTPKGKTRPAEQGRDRSCPQSDLGVLRELVAYGEPTLLFAGGSDLKDRFRPEPTTNPDTQAAPQWETAARRANVLGIFAGHLHGAPTTNDTATEDLKGSAVDPRVAAKTYVAPSLAIGIQTDKPPVERGFLLVTANRTGIASAEVQWFRSAR